MPPAPPLDDFAEAYAYWLYRMNSYIFYNNLFGTAYTTWGAATTVAQLRSAGSTLFACVNNMFFALTDILDASGFTISGMFMSVKYAHDEGVPTDMDSILNAMLAADYDQLQSFIGIEDAFRSAIWDQPFNAEFYAALANGFRP